MVDVPETYWTFCEKCGKHQPHQVTQHKNVKDPLYAQRKWHDDRKQDGYGDQTKPIFNKQAKTTKKTVLYAEPNCSEYAGLYDMLAL